MITLAFGVFLAGGAGAWCRYHLDSFITQNTHTQTPVGILSINTLGSFLLGALTALGAGALSRWLGTEGAQTALVILGTGFLGGFTTFSTAMLQVGNQLRDRRPAGALFLLLVQPLVAFACAALGLAVGFIFSW